MAKKTHLKVRMVPESNPDSKFIYYAKKPTKGEKAKDKLKLKKYNPSSPHHDKALPPQGKNHTDGHTDGHTAPNTALVTRPL